MMSPVELSPFPLPCPCQNPATPIAHVTIITTPSTTDAAERVDVNYLEIEQPDS